MQRREFLKNLAIGVGCLALPSSKLIFDMGKNSHLYTPVDTPKKLLILDEADYLLALDPKTFDWGVKNRVTHEFVSADEIYLGMNLPNQRFYMDVIQKRIADMSSVNVGDIGI